MNRPPNERDGFSLQRSSRQLEIGRTSANLQRLFLWFVVVISVLISLFAGSGALLLSSVFIATVAFQDKILAGWNAIDWIRFESDNFTVRRCGMLFDRDLEAGRISEVEDVYFERDRVRIQRSGAITVWRVVIVARQTYRMEVYPRTCRNPEDTCTWLVGEIRAWLQQTRARD
jgi:hypothetical protein